MIHLDTGDMVVSAVQHKDYIVVFTRFGKIFCVALDPLTQNLSVKAL